MLFTSLRRGRRGGGLFLVDRQFSAPPDPPTRPSAGRDAAISLGQGDEMREAANRARAGTGLVDQIHRKAGGIAEALNWPGAAGS